VRKFAFCLPVWVILPCLLAPAAVAQPFIYYRSVYNAASFTPSGIPGGAIAQGSIFSVFGTKLGPATAVSVSTFPLQNTLSGTSINIVQGTTSIAAIPVYVSAGQVNAIMPSNAPLGVASVQVVVGGQKSNLAPVQIAASQFGVFTALGTGIGPGILQNFITAANQPINATNIAAQTGQAIVLWGTGLGPVSGADNVAPPTGNLPGVKVEVFVGGVSAQITYAGRTPCCSGTDQIVFIVPPNAPQGCWVPVYVRTNGTAVSNFVSMAINASPNSCTTDVLPKLTQAFVGGMNIGQSLTMRGSTRHDVGVRAAVDATGDYHVSYAFEPHTEPFPFNPALAFPPSGTCTVYTHQGDMLNGDFLPGMTPSTLPLDLGDPFLLTGPNGSKTLTYSFSGARAGYLGGSISNNILPSTLFLDPGAYTVRGFGGLNIGPFSTNFTIPTPLNWTNRLQTGVIDRTQPLTLTWTGGDSGQNVAIIGFGEDLPTNSSAVFVCMAPQGSSSFTVPVDMLRNLPVSRPNPLQSKDIVYVLTLAGSSLQDIKATGLDVGLNIFYSILGKTVVFQ
jgi:uncharacterized protein (TIGR03437 family)